MINEKKFDESCQEPRCDDGSEQLNQDAVKGGNMENARKAKDFFDAMATLYAICDETNADIVSLQFGDMILEFSVKKKGGEK